MTPRVVRKLLSNSHFEIIESGKSWIGYFGKHLKGQNYRKMKQGQKVNHFPGCFVLGRKGELSLTKGTKNTAPTYMFDYMSLEQYYLVLLSQES